MERQFDRIFEQSWRDKQGRNGERRPTALT
jgi:hypothetical protein